MEQKKIDKRISYKIVIDTETCPLDRDFEGVQPENMFVYDIGWAVVDKRGNVYESRSFVNVDIFLGERDLMKSAYYAIKIPQYWEDIQNGSRTLKSFYNIRMALLSDIERYGIKQVFAHNMRFDLGTLNNTQRWETKSKYRFFFPYGIEICDTLKLARQLIAPMPTYKKFCEENDFLTKNGRPKLTAEIIYRFITGDMEFNESHTGLEDVMIEKEILTYCYRKHKTMQPLLFEPK